MHLCSLFERALVRAVPGFGARGLDTGRVVLTHGRLAAVLAAHFDQKGLSLRTGMSSLFSASWEQREKICGALDTSPDRLYLDIRSSRICSGLFVRTGSHNLVYIVLSVPSTDLTEVNAC